MQRKLVKYLWLYLRMTLRCFLYQQRCVFSAIILHFSFVIQTLFARAAFLVSCYYSFAFTVVSKKKKKKWKMHVEKIMNAGSKQFFWSCRNWRFHFLTITEKCFSFKISWFVFNKYLLVSGARYKCFLLFNVRRSARSEPSWKSSFERGSWTTNDFIWADSSTADEWTASTKTFHYDYC